MRAASLLLAIAAITALTWPAARARAEGIGIIAPLSGSFSLLGQLLKNGAETAAAINGYAASELAVRDSLCSADGGAAAANALVAFKADIVIGFLCTEAIEAAMPIFSRAGIAVITPGVRTKSLTDDHEKTRWPVFRTAPRADAAEEAAATILVKRWRDEYFAIVDDGTIEGREMAESFRLAAELAGLKAVFVDTYRPQMDNQIGLVGRLKRAGATRVLVGGDGSDVAIMSRDAASMDYDVVFAGGESLRTSTPEIALTDGTLMIGLPKPADIAGPEVLAAFADREIIPEGYAIPAYAAFEIANKARGEAQATGRTVADVLGDGSFGTAMGRIRFDAKGDLADNPYRLFRFEGGKFVRVE